MHQSMQVHPIHPPSPGPIGPAAVNGQDELIFFDRAKKTLEGDGTYDEFLKLLNLFSRDIIDTKTLVDRAEAFLGDGELLSQFKDLLSWEDKKIEENVPPGSMRTVAPEYYALLPPEDGQGPSYRRLQDHVSVHSCKPSVRLFRVLTTCTQEIRMACSGRDRLCWSVLNDVWVSHPTWASEEAGFMTHKKNSFEDMLHKSEEERHEFQVQIEGLTRTIAVLDPLEARIENMSAEERAAFRLKPNLGGTARAIYERTIRKIYGTDAGNEVLRSLQETPAVAVPVVLARLRRKDDEWRRAQREWNRTWREVDGKNFYKALDHQGITFKPNDKKNTTTKSFVLEIENVKAAQLRKRDGISNGKVGGGAESSRGSSRSPLAAATGPSTRPLGYQLQYQFEDVGVLHDAVKMIFTYLDHSPQQFGPQERRAIEKFLRSFIPVLFMFPPHEFNSACGPLAPGHDEDPSEEQSTSIDEEPAKTASRAAKQPHAQEGVSAQDLRTRLLKTAQENGQDGGGDDTSIMNRSASPMATDSPKEATNAKANVNHTDGGEQAALAHPEARTNADDVWVRELKTKGTLAAGESPLGRRPFFAGTTFYTLLRLLQVRVVTCGFGHCRLGLGSRLMTRSVP